MPEPRITVVPGLCGGRPTIRGMRITVADVLADYPYLEREDIAACLDFAAKQARRKSHIRERELAR